MQDDRRAGRRRRTRTAGSCGPDGPRCPAPRACPCGRRRPGSSRDVAEAGEPDRPGRSSGPRRARRPGCCPSAGARARASAAGSPAGSSSTAATASIAAVAASGPWPRPSHRTPVSRPVRLDRAEDVAALRLPGDRPDQPGVADPRRAGRRPEPGHERRALAWHRVQVAEVRQTADGAEPDAQGAARRVTVAQSRGGIRNPGPASMVTSSIPGSPSPWRCAAASTPGWRACAGWTPPPSPRAPAGRCGRGELQPAGQRQAAPAAGGGRAGILDPQPALVSRAWATSDLFTVTT